MKHIWNFFAGLTILLISTSVITSCVKGDFDEPPIYIPKVDFEANTTIAELKASYTGLKKIEDDIIISGIVVANDENGNLFKKLIIQDETAGIELALDKTNLYNEYKLGQRVFVKCKNMYIGDFNNLIQLGYLFEGNIGRLPEVFISTHLFRDSLPGHVPEPQLTEIGDLNYSLISQLLKFENVSFLEVGEMWAPQTANATNRTMTGNGGSLVVRTSRFSDFASEPVPGGVGHVSGILSIFGSTYQLTLRDTSDLHGFSGDTILPPPLGDFVFPQAGITPLASLDEKFDNISDNEDISLPGWTVQATAGTRHWRGRIYQNERYAQATAFQASDPEIKTWMITPPVIFETGMLLSFNTAMAYYEHDGLSVWVLYNYDGSNQEDAVWNEIDATLANASSGNHNWISSGDIDLSDILPAGYAGNIYIGFLYHGSPTNTTTYRIDDVLIGESGGGGGGGGGTGSGTQSDPYDVASAIQLQNQGIVGWVKGFIIGTVKEGVNTVTSSDDLQLSGPFTRSTNVLIADSENETNHTNIVAVNLPAGTVLRAQVNLVDNPDNLGKWLNVNGTLRSYFGIAGSRDSSGEASEFELEDNGGGGGGTSIFLEEFSSDLGNFTGHSITGDQIWGWASFDGGCALMSGYFNQSSHANEDWLISPTISLLDETGVTMNFREAINYITSIDDLKVLISSDYDGTSNPSTNGTWNELTGFTRAPGDSWTFVNSGDVSLAAYEGETIHIAFKYISTASAASTWEISKVEIK